MKTFLTLILTLTLALTTLGAGAEENILQDKDRGAAVRMMQEMLHRKQSSDVKVDGIFGGDTTEYLRAYQSRNGLEPTGKLDVKTKSVLYAPCDYKVYRMECDWETANDIALELGGYLASIDTPEAYDRLAAKLQNFQDATLWIGARRYRRHTFDHSQYYWVKDDGLSTLDPISQTPGDPGIHWAAGEPSFRSADNNQQPEYYVRTRYNNIENCWVWEDSMEQADGFIVAFTDDDSLQKAPDDGPLDPPIIPENAQGYSLEILGLEGPSVVVEVTAEKSCYVEFNFKQKENSPDIFEQDIYEYVEDNVKNHRMRIMLTQKEYDALPDRFRIAGQLSIFENNEKKDEFIAKDCILYDSRKSKKPVLTPKQPSENDDIPVQSSSEKMYTFKGHFVDESQNYDNALKAFHEKCADGMSYGAPPEASFWFVGDRLSFVLDEDVAGTTFHKDDKFAVNDDSPRPWFPDWDAPVNLPEGITCDVGMTVTGYVKSNELEDNNPWFDEWYAPYGKTIVIDNVRPIEPQESVD